jgi:hypothetical protein
MAQIVYRSNFIPTHSHAWDEFGNFLNIDSAVKLQQIQVRKWYLDRNKQVELSLSAIESEKVTPHWKAKPNQSIITSDGIKRNYCQSLHGESYEHTKFKGEIIEKKSFKFQEYTIKLQDCYNEITFLDGKFRADVKAKLMCGTDCLIEVIKTNEISEEKTTAINKNQILTFKLYIDEYGNPKPEKFDIIGNQEIETIRGRIQKGRGAIAEIEERIEEFERFIFRERKESNAKGSFRLLKFNDWLQSRIDRITKEKYRIKSEIDNRQDPISRITRSIESNRNRIKEIKQGVNIEAIRIGKIEAEILRICTEIEQYNREYSELKEKFNYIKSINWNDLFTELESLEIKELELKKGEKITNFKKFLDSHKAIIFSNNHIDIKRNYIERILLVKKLTAETGSKDILNI